MSNFRPDHARAGIIWPDHFFPGKRKIHFVYNVVVFHKHFIFDFIASKLNMLAINDCLLQNVGWQQWMN